MKNLDLAALGVQEVNDMEMKEVNGGVNWWMYLISPGGAYLLSRFEDGYGRAIFTL